MKKLILVKHQAGTSTVEAIGFKGQGCQAATAAIEAALGQVARREDKPELYQQTVSTEALLENRGESSARI